MRKSYLLLAGAGAVLLAACSGDKKTSINDDLKKDLELASSSDGITLANSSPNAGQQVVSAIERTAPPTKQQTPSNRVRHHKPAPKSPPQVVRTEARATVAQEVYLSAGTHDFDRPEMPLVAGKIIIGEDAFIGARAFVLPGITIGARSVVGACSVVTKDVPADVVAAGNPCHVIKSRVT